MARPRKYTAEYLIPKIESYFQWIKENPYIKKDVVKSGMNYGQELKTEVDRMPTVEELCLHVGIPRPHFYWLLNKALEYFETVDAQIEEDPNIEPEPKPSRIDMSSIGKREKNRIEKQRKLAKAKLEKEEKVHALYVTIIRATDKIRSIQISGSGSGLFNPMIVARLNSLKEKTENENVNKNIDAEGKSPDEIKAVIKALENAKKNK